MSGRSAIVTGANGFIGTHLVRHLRDLGWSVTAVTRPERALADDLTGTVEHVEATFADYRSLHTRLGDREGAVLFHLAWDGLAGSALRDYATQLDNAKFATDLVAAAAEMSCRRVVMVGSVNEYEVLAIGDDTSAPLRWTNTYSASKLAAESIGKTVAQRAGLEFVTARPAMTYGPGNYSAMLPNVLLSQLLSGQTPQLITGDGSYDLVHVGEVVEALAAVADRGRDQGTYFVGHERDRTFRQIIQAMRDVVAPGAHLEFGAYPEDNALDFDRIDRAALRRDTEYACEADFAATVKETAVWIEQNLLARGGR